MEIANSPVPVADVSYQKLNFLNRDTSYYSKTHSMTHLLDRFCLLQWNFITANAVKAY
jgi:hypothetical protein